MILVIILVGAFLLYILQNKLYARYWDRQLKINVEFSENQVTAGEKIELIETISNEKWLPLLMLRLKFRTNRLVRFEDMEENVAVSDKTYKNDIFSLLFYQKITRRIPCTCTGRGVMVIDSVDLVSSNLFLTEEYVDTIPVYTEVTVYPRLADCARLEIPFRTMMGEMLSKRRLYEDPFEFRTIREYTGTENFGSINWKATARTGELKVNVHGNTASQHTCILLNLDDETNWASEKMMEECISIAAGLADMLMNAGIAVSFMTNGVDTVSGKEIALEEGKSSGHMDSLLRSLSHIDLKASKRSFIEVMQELKNSKDSSSLGDSLYVMISTATGSVLQKEYDEFCEVAGEGMWIIPYRYQPDFMIGELRHVTTYPWEVNI